MELMRPLLLFVLAALLPQALGKSQKLRLVNYYDLNKKDYVQNKTTTFIKVNKTSTISKVSDLQSAFMDPTCKECHTCMEQAIKAHKIYSHATIERKVNDVPNEIENPVAYTTHRNKRNLDLDTDSKVEKKGSNKTKLKKNKRNKSYSVIKYSDDNDKVYALKIKEATAPLLNQQNQSKTSLTKCQIYKVNDFSSCDSPDANQILHEKKRKVKTPVKEKEKRETILPTEKQVTAKIVPLIRKHHVEDPQMFENYMPSIEDIY